MSRQKNAFEKSDLASLDDGQKSTAYVLGKQFMPMPYSGYFHVETGQIANIYQRHRTNRKAMKWANAKMAALAVEAAQTHDATRLRLLADRLEQFSLYHDPLRCLLLFSKSPTLLFLKAGKCIGDAPAPAPQSAEAWQDVLRDHYPKGEVPTLKNIREVAKELGVEILKEKRGAPKGVPRKAQHRAQR